MRAREITKVLLTEGVDLVYEEKICLALIKQLSDINSETKSGSVQCIERIQGKIKEQNYIKILENLCIQMVEEKNEEQVSIYSLTLASMIHNSAEEKAETVIKIVYSKLYKCLSVINSDI